MRCHYCYNKDVVNGHLDYGMTRSQLDAEIQDKVLTNVKTGAKINAVDYIVISGGEPTLKLNRMHAEHFADLAHSLNFKTKLFTNGSGELPMSWYDHYFDQVSIDLKTDITNPARYHSLTRSYGYETRQLLLQMDTYKGEWFIRTVANKTYTTQEDFDRMYQFLKTIGCTSWTISPLFGDPKQYLDTSFINQKLDSSTLYGTINPQCDCCPKI